MQDVITFAEISEADAGNVGGKGYSLASASRHGLPVPPGFCITADAYRQHSGGGRINDLLWEKIVAAYCTLGSPVVAVRSSATAEDGSETSFAGQQQTLLGIEGEPALRSAIERCWASLNTDRSKAYRTRQAVAEEAPAMAVVVQQLVDADVAGVLFTIDPWDLTEQSLRIEASWGLGEAVVSGRVTPDRYQVNRQTGAIVQRDAGTKKVRVDRDGEHEVPPDQQDTFCLSDALVRQLAELSRKVEAFYGGPRDVEWAFAGDRCWLLQARPITTVSAKERADARTATIERLKKLVEPDGTVWSHTNLKEILKTPTPMTWSLVDSFLLSGGGGSGKMLRDVGYKPDPAMNSISSYDLIGGRPYLNLAREPRMQFAKPLLKYPLAKYKQYPNQALNPIEDNRLHGGISKWWRVVITLKIAMKIASGSNTFADELRKKIIPAYQKKLEELRFHAKTLETPKQVLSQLKRLVTQTLVEFAADSLKPTLYSDYSWKFLERQFIKTFGAEGSVHMLNRVTQGVGPEAEANFPSALREVASGKITREEFIQRFGHRGANEMELSAPRWSENPESLNQLLTSEGVQAPVVQPDKVWEEIMALGKWNPYMAKSLNYHAQQVRTYVSLRETGKHYLMLGYFEIRKLLLRLDMLWKLNGGIFFLRYDELEEVEAERLKDVSGLIARRKRERQVDLSLELPAVLFGDDLEAIGRPLPVLEGATLLKGLALSAGVAEGPALVLTEPPVEIPPAGYILVCPSTDPAWVPLFVSSVGLVMESGGTLSHGAIVAREFGLPAVAGIPDLMRQIETGRRIRVDGGRGLVTLL